MNRRPSTNLLGLLAMLSLVWLVAAISLYFIPHKPFRIDFLRAIALLLRDLAVAGAIMVAGGGVGYRFAPKPHPARIASLALQAGLGIGALSLLILALGFAGLLVPWVGWALLLGLLVGLRGSVRRWLAGWADAWEDLRPGGWALRGIAVLALSWLVMTFFEAAAPPARFDALVYHLALPQRFVVSGSIGVTPDNPFWGSPLGSEMLYTWAMLLARPQAAALLGWAIGGVALLGVYGLGRHYGPEIGWVALAGLLSGETIASSMGWAYADWPVALYSFGILAALDSWDVRDGAGPVVLAGALAGLAFGAKYTAGTALLAGSAMIFAKAGMRKSGRPILLFGSVAALIFLPWLLKNHWGTGAPLFPFLGENSLVSPVRQAFYRGLGPERSALQILFTPLAASLQGVEGSPGYAADIGPLMIGLLPAVFLHPSLRRRLWPMTAFLIAGFAVWAIASSQAVLLGQSRLYFALFPAWALLSGGGYAALARVQVGSVRLGRLAMTLVLIVMALSVINGGIQAQRHRPLPAALGLESEPSYLFRRLTTLYSASEAVRDLTGEATVLNLWEPRGLYCLPTCRPDVWIDRWFEARSSGRDAGQILELWKSEGATHILLFRSGMEFTKETDLRYSVSDWVELESLLAELETVELFGDSYELYQVPE